ncbi:MAG: hypothetical protein JWR80_3171 [Bradyrhizobium sp.]|nr:hypothetical protein [Bradyrhizobium sp.]
MKNFIIIMILFAATYAPVYLIVSPQLRKFIGANFVLCFTLATLGGFILPNRPIFFAALFIIFVATVRSRMDTACRYILLAALVPQIVWGVDVGGHFIGFIDPLGLLGLAAYTVGKFYSIRSGRNQYRKFAVEDWLVLVIFLIMAVGGAGIGEFYLTIRAYVTQFMLILMPYIFLRSNLRGSSEYRIIIACFGISAIFLSVFAIYEARSSWTIFEGMGRQLGVVELSKNMLRRGSFMRASATMGGPLVLACFLTVGLIAVACSRDFFRSRFGYYGALAISLMGLLAAQSRGSLVALLVSAIVLSMALRKWGVAAGMAGAAMVAVPALPFLARYSPALTGFMNLGEPMLHGKYYDYRGLLLDRGLEEAARHPIIGMRLEDVLAQLSDIMQGQHIVDLVNVYLVIFLISGVVGMIPFVSLVSASGLRATVGFGKIRDPSLLMARAFCLAAFAAVLMQLSFMSFIDRIPMNFVLILAGLRLVTLERQAARKRGATAPIAPPDDSGQVTSLDGSLSHA